MGERLSKLEVDDKAGWGHKVRYRLASGFINDGDSVVDAACGIGYGAEFLLRPNGVLHRIDLLPQKDRVGFYGVGLGYQYIDHTEDLTSWEPNYKFDVAISFETIEHLEDYSNLLTQLKKANKWVICSVPVVPTVHLNEYHKHDFKPLEFPGYFEDDNWELYQYLGQPQELSEIYIFKRRDYNG